MRFIGLGSKGPQFAPIDAVVMPQLDSSAFREVPLGALATSREKANDPLRPFTDVCYRPNSLLKAYGKLTVIQT